ncbi:uncharacterized protein [Clytia hemisphaerica]|uniref:EGF-like domain-containing protein n=1 Tax=Clytia hemisphaerica TaxID=252671 RepID=A0A7M5WJJ2_9CNID
MNSKMIQWTLRCFILINILYIQNTRCQTSIIVVPSSSESVSLNQTHTTSGEPASSTIPMQPLPPITSTSSLHQAVSSTINDPDIVTSSSASVSNQTWLSTSASNQIEPSETVAMTTAIDNGGGVKATSEITQPSSSSVQPSVLNSSPAVPSMSDHVPPLISSVDHSTTLSTSSQVLSQSLAPAASSPIMESSSPVNIMTTMEPNPKAAPKHCNDVIGSYCENGGVCFNQTGTETKPVCSCIDEYYGEKCDKKIVPKLYMQLTYALGGTTGFLLIVVICLVCCRCQKRKTGKGELPFSEELDSFSVGSKRASKLFPSNGSSSNGKNSVSVMSFENNGIDMYGD